ncbi:TetR/AcrR family transcriptional regulator [Leptospira venezuelensis]|uniref:TetR/AcrR family transcriptional regulator n=1 Tax=Leptospira venezuelensis TaxID=1958811 RepID=UPI000A39EAB9|nr:TetR/AcrR family transcriptional regulator [Leptospira venezuelensis]
MKKEFRAPVQSRSKERVELILNIAKKLIGERGIDSVSMREIANLAEVQIGSLYQYFGGKEAVLLAIMRQYYDLLYEQTKAILEPVRNIKELEIAAEKAMGQYVELFRNETALSNLWAGAQAMPELIAEDNKDSFRNADLIVKTTMRCLPGLKESDVKPFALYFSHTLGTIVRFSMEIDEKYANFVLNECKNILKLRLKSFQEISLKKEKQKSHKV